MKQPLGLSRCDGLAAALLWAATVAVFAAGAGRLGFYYDDGEWMISMPAVRLAGLWPLLAEYIPGRNLFPLWQYLLYGMVGGDPAGHLTALHLFQSVLDGLVVAGFFLLLRLLLLPGPAALLAAGLFGFWPIHGETHFWHTSLGANMLPVLFTIAFALTSAAAVRRRATPGWAWWLLDALAFLGALFTYDQVALVLLGMLVLRLALALRERWDRHWLFAAAHLLYLAVLAFWVKVRMAPRSSPPLSTGAWRLLLANIPATISDTFGRLWLRQLAPLLQRATLGDWALALLVASALTGLAVWLLWRQPPPDAASGRRPLPDTASERLALPDTASERLPLPDTAGRRLPIPDTAGRRLPLPDADGERLPFPATAGGRLPLPDAAGERPQLLGLFVLSILFYFGAYLPVWLWHLSPRHHYLPSIGLFGGGAVCLAWILERASGRAMRALMVLVLGAATLVLAAAGRGQSRYWEDSFGARKQFFAELKPDLEGKQVLVLDGFPPYLGPAYFFSPQDAAYAPRLLYGESLPLGPHFTGSIGSAPAPAGIFLRTLAPIYRTDNFLYYPTGPVLVARFLGWDQGRLRYEKNPPMPLPYQVLSSSVTPQSGHFTVHKAEARRRGAGLLVSLDLVAALPPHTSLAALLSIFHKGEFHYWGRFENDFGLNLSPLLLDAPQNAGSRRWVESFDLYSFPVTDRVRFEFFAAGRDRPPALLGRAEASVQP